VGVASSAFFQAAQFLKKKPAKNNNALPDSETLQEKTKRMIIDDQEEWLRFQEDLRRKGITTNAATRESLCSYINDRRSEEAIDKCLDGWEKSERRLSTSMTKFKQRTE